MAKRRKHRKTHRRRRIGALALNASSPLVKYGSVAAGYFMGDKVNEAIDKATGGKVDGKIVAAAEALLGFMLLTKGKKSTLKVAAGGVMLGAGVKRGLAEFGVISGFADVPVIAGYKSVPVLNGYVTRPGQMAGYMTPQPMSNRQNVMGAVDVGSGTGLGYMDSDR